MNNHDELRRADKSNGFNNTSGGGPNATVPDEIKGWNWGALLLAPFWSIAHNVWIGLLCLVPYAGFIMIILLGLKGNEWAWQNRKFESIEQFKEVQRIWTYWAIAIIGLGALYSVILGFLRML